MNKIDRIIELLESINEKLSSPSEKKKRSPKKERVHEEKEPFWQAYSSAFEQRWKVMPERNAMINGMIVGIKKRVSQEDLIPLVEFYLKQNDAWYLREMHHVRCLVKDCEILLTRMKSKVVMTSGKAQEMERAATNFSEAKSYLEKKHGSQ